jgi:membrane associated rhomboid family serine protease
MTEVKLSHWKKFPPAILNIIIINVIVFVAQQMMVGDGNSSLTNTLSLHYFKADGFRWWQLFTHWFCHGSVQHLLGNMVVLWLFGQKIENLMGTQKFIIIYIASGIGATLLHLGLLHYEYMQLQGLVNAFQLSPTQPRFHAIFKQFLNSEVYNNNYREALNLDASWLNDPFNNQFTSEAKEITSLFLANAKTGITLGASGAVCGVMAAFGYLFPNDRVYGYLPFGIKYILPLILIAEIYYGAFYSAGSNIAHFAHAGGIIFGVIAVWIFNKFNRKHFY